MVKGKDADYFFDGGHDGVRGACWGGWSRGWDSRKKRDGLPGLQINQPRRKKKESHWGNC